MSCCLTQPVNRAPSTNETAISRCKNGVIQIFTIWVHILKKKEENKYMKIIMRVGLIQEISSAKDYVA